MTWFSDFLYPWKYIIYYALFTNKDLLCFDFPTTSNHLTIYVVFVCVACLLIFLLLILFSLLACDNKRSVTLQGQTLINSEKWRYRCLAAPRYWPFGAGTHEWCTSWYKASIYIYSNLVDLECVIQTKLIIRRSCFRQLLIRVIIL